MYSIRKFNEKQVNRVKYEKNVCSEKYPRRRLILGASIKNSAQL